MTRYWDVLSDSLCEDCERRKAREEWEASTQMIKESNRGDDHEDHEDDATNPGDGTGTGRTTDLQVSPGKKRKREGLRSGSKR